MNTKILIAALLAGVAAVVLVVIPDGSRVVVDGELAVAETLETVTLPSDLPDGIPLYPGATLERVQDVPSDNARNITLMLRTDDSVADVNTWYRGALSQNDWAITSDQNVGGYILLRSERDTVAIFTQAARADDAGGAIITERVQIK